VRRTARPTPTVVGVQHGAGRASCTLRGGLLSPRLLTASDDEVRVSLVATQALLLGWDEVDIDIDVGPGMLLELVDTAGTVAYNSGGAPSWWRVRARVGAGAALLWQGEPLVVADGADVCRSLHVELAVGAVACLRETVVLGRSGERGGAFRTTADVRLAGAPLYREDLHLDASDARDAPGILHGARCLDAVQLYGMRPAAEGPALRLDLAGPGSLARYLGDDLHPSPLPAVWQEWSRQVRDYWR
jgi:urease accessory protein